MHDAAGEAVGCITRPIGEPGNGRGQLAVSISFCQFPTDEFVLALALFDGAIAQHQMREIKVELVGWHIGAFGHEAHVAQCAGIDDRFEIFGGDGIQLLRFGFVNQIKQTRE